MSDQPSETGRVCVFCGGRAGSAEHIFANWINDVFPVLVVGEPQAVLGTLARDGDSTERRWKSTGVATQITKEVCHECNTGWMSRLEGKAKPLLTPMMTGVPTRLTLDEQITVATWATKTAITAELVHGHDFNFSPEERRIVMTEQRPPAHVAVMASAIETDIGPCRATVARGQVVNATNEVVAWMHVHTVQVGTLVFQVLRSDPPMGGEVAFKTVQFAAPIEIPIFPPSPNFSWPPKTVLTEDRFLAHTQRIGSNIAIESFLDNQKPFTF